MLAIACKDGSVQLWNVQEAKASKLLALERTVGFGVVMAFNHRGDLLATTSWDGVMRLWDPRTGKQVKQLDNWAEMRPCFSPDDSLLAARTKEDVLQIWHVISTGECRTFVPEVAVGHFDYPGAITPDGRLLAVGMEEGVGLWDLKTTRFLASLPVGMTYGVAMDRSAQPSLFTNGAKGGVVRWPIDWQPKSARMRIGPAQILPLPGPFGQIAVSHDGQIVGQLTSRDGGRAFWQFKEQLVSLTPHGDARYVAINPDSRLIATGSHNGHGARVWDSQSGKLIQELLPTSPSWDVEFSGDGQWLATRYPACQLWKVGTWEKGRQFDGGRFCFAPDGKMLAVETGRGVVRLMDPASGRELAHLENPYQEQAIRIVFSPDGAFLVTIGGESYPIHVWDLRRIRRQLAQLDLDWDLPPFPPESPAWSNGPLQLQVEWGDMKGGG